MSEFKITNSKGEQLKESFIREASLEDLDEFTDHLSEDDKKIVKVWRRKLKQRGYKKNYDKKIKKIDSNLESDVRRMKDEKTSLEKEKNQLILEIERYRKLLQ